jgi:hypothetical protein
LLLLQLSFLLGDGRCSSGHESRQDRLVSDGPSLRVKVGLLYLTNGAIRELPPPKNKRTLARSMGQCVIACGLLTATGVSFGFLQSIRRLQNIIQPILFGEGRLQWCAEPARAWLGPIAARQSTVSPKPQASLQPRAGFSPGPHPESRANETPQVARGKRRRVAQLCSFSLASATPRMPRPSRTLLANNQLAAPPSKLWRIARSGATAWYRADRMNFLALTERSWRPFQSQRRLEVPRCRRDCPPRPEPHSRQLHDIEVLLERLLTEAPFTFPSL